ncbi:MAG: hypothetical protein ABJA79_00950 [Parafilimonas sp.]
MLYLKTYSRWIVIEGTLLIWIVKFIVRPFMYIPEFFKPMIGISPNLIGSFLLPFSACWLFQKYFRLHTIADLKITCWFGLLLVIINEYLQLIPFFGRTFDPLDILASFAGVYMGYYFFSRLMERRMLHQPA